MSFTVFLSHSTKDKDFVIKLAAELEDASIKPWLCEVDIDYGEDFVAKIEKGLDDLIGQAYNEIMNI